MYDYFVKDIPDYKGDPINTYGTALVRELTRNGIENPTEKAKAIIKDNIVNPRVNFYTRDSNNDTYLTHSDTRSYITQYQKHKNDQVFVPTTTTYKKNVRALISEMQVMKLKVRGEAKTIAKDAEKAGDIPKFTSYNTIQGGHKMDSNGHSGATASMGTVFYNRTGHNTLTSTTASLTSAANMLTEILLTGNRFIKNAYDLSQYWLTIQTIFNKTAVREVINKYDLKIPTNEDLAEIVKRSMLQYSVRYDIDETVYSWMYDLTDEERVWFAYKDDLYHLLKLNEGFTKGWMRVMSDTTVIAGLEYVKILDDLPEWMNMQIRMSMTDRLVGDSSKYKDLVKRDPQLVAEMGSMAYRTIRTYKYLDPYIKLFLTTSIPPMNAHRTKELLRRGTGLSDTDSSGGIHDEIASIVINRDRHYTIKDVPIVAITTAITSEALAHYIRVMEKIMNISDEQSGRLAYKNEFYFSVFNVSGMTKHYTASVRIKEGFTYPEEQREVKGVHNKNSRTLERYINTGYKIMDYIHTRVREGNNLVLEEFLKLGDRLEKVVAERITNNDIDALNRNQIKELDSYAGSAKPGSTPYFHVMLWKAAFQDRYPVSMEMPLTTRSIPLTTTTKTKTNKWLDTLDSSTRMAIVGLFNRTNKDKLPTVQLPEEYLMQYGIPKEFEDIIDKDSILLSALKNSYIPLVSVGAKKLPHRNWLEGHPQVDFSKVRDIYDEIGFDL